MTTCEQTEVMARICYDFTFPGFGDHRITGSIETRRLSIAQSTIAKLNEWYGEGSHWVEPLNWTWEERPGSDGETVPAKEE